MDLMNRVFNPYLDQFFVVFIDDILIYSRSTGEHNTHFHMILQCLRNNQLKVKLKKCEFWLDCVTFLGHVASKKGISINPSNVEAIMMWGRPITMTEIHNFLRLIGYY